MQENQETSTPPSNAAEASDQDLLHEYASTGAETSFARLVKRHVGMVYSAAIRQTGSHAMAQDVTQAVFIILARKAASIRRETVLSGWLFRAVRYAALDARKMESRREARELEAARMQLTDSLDETSGEWDQMAPLLDEALASLGAKDRHAVLLRFFEKKSFVEVGATLGGNENSARVRVVRAMEKLRGFFRRRGIAVSVSALSGALFSNGVQAAPSGLESSLVACGMMAGRSATEGLIQAVLQRFRWERLVRIGVAVLLFLLLAVGTPFAIRQRMLAPTPRLASAPRSLRDTLMAIDRTFSLDNPTGFVALIQFRNAEEERFKPVLTQYIQAESEFRREMRQAFNVQQRTFDVTFRELCVGQPPVLTNYIGADRGSTNVMTGKYPIHFIKVGETWYWDWFGGLSGAAREERLAGLKDKSQRLRLLAQQVRDGTATNVTGILQALQSPSP